MWNVNKSHMLRMATYHDILADKAVEYSVKTIVDLPSAVRQSAWEEACKITSGTASNTNAGFKSKQRPINRQIIIING